MTSGKPSLGIADWLSLGAAPVFALMTLLTLIAGDHHIGALCSQGGAPSALTGMAPMYLLMALFHLAPWLRLRTAAGR
ncbi:MAG TPA: hypothetical protein VGD23_06890 [Sphingomicrobium sp.]